MQDTKQLANILRETPALASKEVRNEAIRLEYWERIRNGEGYCQAAHNTAVKFNVGERMVYEVRNLTTKTVKPCSPK